MRISIQDVHLLFQIVAFSSDMITAESVSKLKEIHDNIEEREVMHKKKRGKTEKLNNVMPLVSADF